MRISPVRSASAVVILVAAILGICVSGAGTAGSAPSDSPRILKTEKVSDRQLTLTVHSQIMRKAITVSVLLPANQSAPRSTVYMLDGAGAEDQLSDWLGKGKAVEFFADKRVNVVLPAGGKGTFYTDWEKRDAAVGKPMWETFLTKELPPLIDAAYSGNGTNAVVGLSMGGQAALALTARHPKLFTGAASLSGCPPVSGAANEGYVRATVARDGADASNMWGPFGSAGWAAHDPSLRLDQLRGKNIYLYAGTGAVGPKDFARKLDKGESRNTSIAAGSVLEMGAYRCSLEFAATLRLAGIPATENFPVIGTHSWPYWSDSLPELWPTISRGL